MSALKRAKRLARLRLTDSQDMLLRVVSQLPVHRIRTATVRALGATVSDSATLYSGWEIRRPDRLVIGERTNVGDRSILDARGGLTIGDDVNLSTEVHIWTAQHGWQSPDFAYETKPVVIEDHAWLGPRVTVLPGAHIGRGARVAAGAVVHGRLEPNTLYGGVPAKRIAAVDGEFGYQLPAANRKPWWR